MSSLGSLTKQEKEQLIEIDKKYEPSFKAVRDKLMKLDIETNHELYFQVCEEENEIHDKWMKERGEIHKKAEERAFRNFGGDVETIAEAVKNQIPTYIMVTKILAGEKPTEQDLKEQREQEETHRQYVIDAIKNNEKLLNEHPDDQELIEATNGLKELLNNLPLQTTYEITFSDETLRNNINDSFRIYLEFLKKANINVYKDVQRFIEYLIENKERLDELYTLTPNNEEESKKTVIDITTRKPKKFITPVDKVSNKAFENGILYSNRLLPVAMEKRGSDKKVDTMVSISFDEMEKRGVHISGRKELTAYDREVHDAIITLFVNGKNECVTPQMIYQTMTGNDKVNISKNQAESISNSVTKLMYSSVTIDATKEAEAFGFDTFKYSGNLLHAERVTATINNNVLEAIHILRTPVLYEYADRKGQIGRFELKLLNSPVNKNEETITLQGYLYRRILSIKGNRKLSPTIVYDTIYKKLEVSAASDGALRKKKAGVRKKIKDILDYWKKEKFIAGYVENKRGQEMYSVTIRI